MNVKVGTHTLTIEIENDINAGEYNITPVNFEFSEEYEGLTKMAVFTACGSEPVKEAILNNQCIIPLEVLEQPGVVSLGVYGYETYGTDLELRYSPKAQNFNVKVGSYREGNDPDLPVPSEWERVLELINEAITETNNLNIDVNKEDNTTTITLTKKDGTTKIVQVEDGKSLEFNWRGTELGIRQEGQSSYEYVNLKGDKGDAGAIKMQIVAELPQTGQDDTIYLVPLEHPDIQGNNYAEYVWINNAWELLGKIGVQVDLTDYVKNTDYATSSKGGVIKTGMGTQTLEGTIAGEVYTYASYENLRDLFFISKGTLENVISGKGLIDKNVNDLTNYTTTNAMNNLLANKLDTSKVVNANSTTAGETYDVRYINTMIGDIETILTTLDIGGGING